MGRPAGRGAEKFSWYGLDRRISNSIASLHLIKPRTVELGLDKEQDRRRYSIDFDFCRLQTAELQFHDSRLLRAVQCSGSKITMEQEDGAVRRCSRGTALYFWGESLPCVDGVAFEASTKERQDSDVTETPETRPSAALLASEERPLCNWRCIRLPFVVRALACGDEHFAVVSSNGALFVSSRRTEQGGGARTRSTVDRLPSLPSRAP